LRGGGRRPILRVSASKGLLKLSQVEVVEQDLLTKSLMREFPVLNEFLELPRSDVVFGGNILEGALHRNAPRVIAIRPLARRKKVCGCRVDFRLLKELVRLGGPRISCPQTQVLPIAGTSSTGRGTTSSTLEAQRANPSK
jgi:hypothetical protein